MKSKVYLPAIYGIVPDDMVRAFRAFLEFCYLVRRNVIDGNCLREIENALERFRHYREIFVITKVRPEGISLPRQHSIFHYPTNIRNFASPGGTCTTLSESKHIVAIKRPYRRSNKHNALFQILITNERLDKLAAARINFTSRGMLDGTCLDEALKVYEMIMSTNYVSQYAFISDKRSQKERRTNVPNMRIRLRKNLLSARTRTRMSAKMTRMQQESLKVRRQIMASNLPGIRVSTFCCCARHSS